MRLEFADRFRVIIGTRHFLLHSRFIADGDHAAVDIFTEEEG